MKTNVSSQHRGMTFVELLIVVSMVAVVGLALYNSLSNGIKVWEKSRQLIIEEDVVIFFDKIAMDLRNTIKYSLIPFKGDSNHITIPTIVHTLADRKIGYEKDTYIDQIGKVEYYYNFNKDAIYRRQSNYSESLKEGILSSREMVSSIKAMKFEYVYLTETGEIVSDNVLEVPPMGVTIILDITDDLGERRVHRYIDVPIGS